MSTPTIIGDLTEENLSNVSMPGHHRSHTGPTYDGPTLPLPTSPQGSEVALNPPPPLSTIPSFISENVIVIELPMRSITYSQGIPILPHYHEGRLNDPSRRFRIPTALKTF